MQVSQSTNCLAIASFFSCKSLRRWFARLVYDREKKRKRPVLFVKGIPWSQPAHALTGVAPLITRNERSGISPMIEQPRQSVTRSLWLVVLATEPWYWTRRRRYWWGWIDWWRAVRWLYGVDGADLWWRVLVATRATTPPTSWVTLYNYQRPALSISMTWYAALNGLPPHPISLSPCILIILIPTTHRTLSHSVTTILLSGNCWVQLPYPVLQFPTADNPS
jgi:hypothetical protein